MKVHKILFTIIIITISLFLLKVCGSQWYLATENANFEKNREKSKLNCNVTALHCAIRDNNLDSFQRLITNNIDLELKDNWGQTSLYWAAVHNKPEYIKKLLNLGANLNVKNEYGEPIIVAASRSGNIESVSLLIDSGVNVNAVNHGPGGQSALHASIGSKNTKMVKLLLDNGADITARDALGKTSLQAARDIPLIPIEIIKLLEQKQSLGIKHDNGTPGSRLSYCYAHIQYKDNSLRHG